MASVSDAQSELWSPHETGTRARAAEGDAPLDRSAAVAQLEKQLASTPRGQYPYQHAGLAYRLGLAYAESAGASPAQNLRKALACYDVAASIFDPRFDPVPHARVLNAAGATHRALGDRNTAARLFTTATELLEGRDRDEERAAAFNNLGLIRTELGQPEAAIEACDQAIDLFDPTTPEGQRGLAAAYHTRGSARAALGTAESLQAALDDYELGLEVVGSATAPYHYALLGQASGVAAFALAAFKPEQADRLLQSAEQAIAESLTIFTRTAFPYQYALGKNNVGLAMMRRSAVRESGYDLLLLRSALASFEETVAVLDPRIYRAEWRQGYDNLERVEAELARAGAEGTRVEHFAALLGASTPEVRTQLLRERLTRLLLLPDNERRRSLAELALATARLDYEAARGAITAELNVLMEQPGTDLQAGLEARFAAHQTLDEAQRETADRALDQAIGDALGGPQRMYVRDFLYGLGWERP